MSHTAGSTSDPSWAEKLQTSSPSDDDTSTPVSDYRPAWDGSSSLYSQYSDDEDDTASDDTETCSCSEDDSTYESSPYVPPRNELDDLALDTLRYFLNSVKDTADSSDDESSDTMSEPGGWTGEYSSLDPVPPPNLPVPSWFEDEDSSGSSARILDTTEAEIPRPIENTQIPQPLDNTANEHEEMDTSDPFHLVFETTEVSRLSIDGEEEPESNRDVRSVVIVHNQYFYSSSLTRSI
ncbi:hypothetical protein ACHAP5_003509 [Fusarium lateritium]